MPRFENVDVSDLELILHGKSRVIRHGGCEYRFRKSEYSKKKGCKIERYYCEMSKKTNCKVSIVRILSHPIEYSISTQDHIHTISMLPIIPPPLSPPPQNLQMINRISPEVVNRDSPSASVFFTPPVNDPAKSADIILKDSRNIERKMERLEMEIVDGMRLEMKLTFFIHGIKSLSSGPIQVKLLVHSESRRTFEDIRMSAFQIEENENQLSSPIFNSKRRKFDTSTTSQSSILCVSPPREILRGGYCDIFFSLSIGNYFERLLRRDGNIISMCQFGGRDADFEKVMVERNEIKLKDIKEKYPSLHEKASNAQFRLPVRSPPVERACIVDVSIGILGIAVLTLPNGYTYIDKQNEEKDEIKGNTSEFENEFDDSLFPNEMDSIFSDDSLEIGIDDDDNDIFGANIMFYAVSQNRMDIVKKCLEKGFDVSKKDVLGFTAIDVAVHFERKEIYDLLLKVQSSREEGKKETGKKEKLEEVEESEGEGEIKKKPEEVSSCESEESEEEEEQKKKKKKIEEEKKRNKKSEKQQKHQQSKKKKKKEEELKRKKIMKSIRDEIFQIVD